MVACICNFLASVRFGDTLAAYVEVMDKGREVIRGIEMTMGEFGTVLNEWKEKEI
jgi:acyl dehydratase